MMLSRDCSSAGASSGLAGEAAALGSAEPALPRAATAAIPGAAALALSTAGGSLLGTGASPLPAALRPRRSCIFRRIDCTLLEPQPFQPALRDCCAAGPAAPAATPGSAASAAALPCPSSTGSACSVYSRQLRSRMTPQYALYMASMAASRSPSWHHQPRACSHCCLAAGSSAGARTAAWRILATGSGSNTTCTPRMHSCLHNVCNDLQASGAHSLPELLCVNRISPDAVHTCAGVRVWTPQCAHQACARPPTH